MLLQFSIFFITFATMKFYTYLFALCLLSIGIKAQSTYDTGISQQLAEQRAAAIHGLEYRLFFSIPEDKQVDIAATEEVSFMLDSKGEVVLDFRESKEKIHAIYILGKKKPLEWRFENEHVIIPEEYTRKGRNAFKIEFTAGNQSLNRNDEYMYTLFVPDRARTCFPCFDQPDLKAKFHLTLEIPADWTAVANDPLVLYQTPIPPGGWSRLYNGKKGRKVLTTTIKNLPSPTGGKGKGKSADTPLPTYLFAFAAGKFQYEGYKCQLPDGAGGERDIVIGAYYRETDNKRIAQLPEIIRQVLHTLRWQEEYTGHPYGFSKYDLVILPGFQFGGMEHTGCTFYNDNTLFLSPNPTPDEILSRANLIAHETTHMWFGDLVTMRWFNDVWTKEVFANYFAAEIITPLFRDYNFDLYWLQRFKQDAISEDRTEGRTAIQQPLDNMRNAGLIYNNIIYNKAPLMMREIVRLMGKEAFQRGIRRYVHDFAYGNATWDDLVRILNEETEIDLEKLSNLWVKQTFYPTVKATSARPNPDGRAYGYFDMTAEQIDSLMAYWPSETDATARQSYLMTLYENYLHGHMQDISWMEFVIKSLKSETDPLTLSTLISYLAVPIWQLEPSVRADIEAQLLKLAEEHPDKSCRLQLLRFLSRNGNSDFVNKQMYVLWRYCDNELLSVTDYMTMAYELAVRFPTLAKDIITEEEGRIDNPDRLRQFQYISRAVSPDSEARDSLFQWLLIPENRRVEPWAGSALAYLNHPLRDVESSHYIVPALEALEDIQRTGDIFFPGRWCNSLLSGHRSRQALAQLESFLNSHPDYPQLLKNKILTAAYYLQRQWNGAGE